MGLTEQTTSVMVMEREETHLFPSSALLFSEQGHISSQGLGPSQTVWAPTQLKPGAPEEGGVE